MLGRMNTPFACLVLLLFVLALAGCNAPAASEPANTLAPFVGASQSADLATENATGQSQLDPRAVGFVAVWEDSATGAGAICAPTQVGVCEFYLRENVTLTGDWKGYAIGVVHGHYDPATPDHLYWVKNLVFTGSIAGCGFGSVQLTVPGWFNADTGGVGVHANETIRRVPGSATDGLSTVVDLVAYGDGYIGPEMAMLGGVILPIKGTVWC